MRPDHLLPARIQASRISTDPSSVPVNKENPIEETALRELSARHPDEQGVLTKSKAIRRGPQPGSVRRFAGGDRALYSEYDQLRQQGMTKTAASLKLGQDGKLAGHGTPDSRAKRFREQYEEDQKLGPTCSD